MKPGDRVEVFVPKWLAERNGTGTLISGTILNRTDKAIRIDAVSVMRRPPSGEDGVVPCRFCNRPLTEEASISLGYGPDCAVQHLGLGNKQIRDLKRALTRKELQAAETATRQTLWLPLSSIKVVPFGTSALKEAEVRAEQERRRRELIIEVKDQAVAVADSMRHEEVSTDPLPIPLPLDCEPRPYQWRGARFMADARRVFNWDLMGLGKEQSLDSKLLTPHGWVRMGDIKLGDMVIGSDGKPTRVIGVYPQGIKEIFRVEFSDGSSAECGDEHLWAVRSAPETYADTHWRVMSLAEIRKSLKDGNGNSVHFIPMVGPVEFDPLPDSLPLDPYILGVLLGDGSITHSVGLTSMDQEILDMVTAALPPGLCLKWRGRYQHDIVKEEGGTGKNLVKEALRSLGLFGHGAESKFIPDLYLRASAENRLAILRGLLDTDGSCTAGGTVEFSSASRQLANDVAFLVQSLGGTVKMRTRQPWYTTPKHPGVKIQGKESHRLTIAMPPEFNPFRLERKAERWHPREKYLPSRAIRSVTSVGLKPAQCIMVDAQDSLYVTDDFIVTHNTIQGILFMMEATRRLSEEGRDGPCVVICPPVMVKTWVREIEKWWQGVRVQALKGWSAKIDPKAHVYVMPWSVLSSGWEPKIGPDGRPLTQLVKDKDGKVKRKIVPDTSRVKLSGTARGILEQSASVIVGDEAHNAKNPDAQRSRATKLVSLPAAYVALMTGTAVLNRPQELTTQLDIADLLDEYFDGRDRFEVDFCNKQLKDQYIKGGGVRKVFKFEPPTGRQLVELHKRLTPFVIRRRTEDVIKDMPPMTLSRVVVDLDNRAEYDAFEAEIAALPPMARLGKLAQLRQMCGVGKISSMIEWIENFLECDEKLVVFATHRQVQRALLEHFEKWKPARILGQSEGGSVNKNQKEMDRFQQDPDCLLAVCSTGAAREGITLTAAANLLMTELEWVPGIMDQAWKRCVVEGQLVTTSRGTVPIEEVVVGDSVLTHLGNWGEVSDVWSKQHQGLITELDYVGYPEPLKVTHDHRVLIKRKGEDSPYWVEAHTVLPGDRLLLPIHKAETDVTTLKIEDDHRFIPKSDLLRWSECLEEGCSNPPMTRNLCNAHRLEYRRRGKELPPQNNLRHGHGHYRSAPESLEITDDLLYALGRFAADGSASISAEGRGKGSISIAGHSDEIEAVSRAIGSIAEAFGAPHSTERKKGLSCEGKAYSIDAALWLRSMFGVGARNKMIPQWVMDLPTRRAGLFLRGYFDGDGYLCDGIRQEWTTTSPHLAVQVSILSAKTGHRPILRRNTKDARFNAMTWFGSIGTVPVGTDYVELAVKSVTTKHAQRPAVDGVRAKRPRVYDLTVEGDHSFVVGLAAVHNCHRIGQTSPVFIWNLAAEDSMDDTLMEKMANKRLISGEILDGQGEVLDESVIKQAVVEDLVRRVARRKRSKKKEAA